MEASVGDLIQGGGAVALAILVWLELRAFRVEVTQVLVKIAERQGVIYERQAVLHRAALGTMTPPEPLPVWNGEKKQ